MMTFLVCRVGYGTAFLPPLKKWDKEKNYFQRHESEILGQVTKFVLYSEKF